MSTEKPETLELTRAELMLLCDLAAKELLRQIYHNRIDPVVSNLVRKGAAALAPPSETNAKEKIST